MRLRSRPILLVTALTMIVAACSSGPSAETQAFCDEYIDTISAVNIGPADDPETWVAQVSGGLESLKSSAPQEVSSAVTGMADALLVPIAALDEEGFLAVTESEGYIAHQEIVNGFVVSDCGLANVDVTAVDYAFEVDLDEVQAGTTAFTFQNDGTELHEMALIRINDDVTESVEELLELPEEEAEAKSQFTGVVFATPGTSSTMFADLEDGRYVILCFVPTGSTSMEDMETADGPPHFAHGMVEEFTVTG